MHLDVGEVDLTLHIHVAAVRVQSHAPSDDLSNCTGHAAAVSSQRSSDVGRNDCIGGFGNQMCHVSVAPLTWCGLAWLDRNSWMNRRCGGRQLGVVQTPVTHRVPRRSVKNAQMTRLLAPLVPKSARVVSGRRHNCLRMLADHLTCRDGRSAESILERGSVTTLAARRSHQTALGTFLKFGKERALPLVEDVEIDGALVAYSNDCFIQRVQHHHGSQLLAAVMDRCPSFSRFGSGKLPRNHPHVAVSILNLWVTYMRPSELSDK